MVDKNEMVIEVGLKDNTKKGTDSVNKNQESIEKTSVETSLAMKAAWTAAFAAVAIGSVEIIRVTAEFQKLRAMLKVATGDAARAAVAFDAIKQFALETPFTIQQVTESFIKLKNLGLDPSMESLRSYGNTAAAMGKDVMQFIEAVADASVGEFERLKEFGIKASKQGDEVAFTFRGVTTTVKNSSEDIQGYLQDIGNTEFAGSMQAQMETLDGAFSNAGVAIDNLADALGSELSPAVIMVANAFAVALDNLRAFLAPNTNDEIKALTEDLEQLSAQIGEQEELGNIGSEFTESLELQSRIVVQRLEELKAKVKTDKLTLADITAGDKAGEVKVAAATAAEGGEFGPQIEPALLTQRRGLEEFIKEQDNRFIELEAERLEKVKQLNIDAAQTSNQASLDKFNYDAQLRKASFEAAVDTARREAEAKKQYQAEVTASTLSAAQSSMDINTAVLELTGKNSKKNFETQKKLNIALTVANTAAMAIAAGRDTPGAWYIKAAAVAAALSTGFQQVSAIRSTTYGGGGATDSSVSSAIAVQQPSAAANVQDQPTQTAVTEQQQGPSIAVNTGGFLGKWIEEEFSPAWEEAQSRGVGLVIT